MLVGSAGGGFLCCYATTANSVFKKVGFFLVKAEKLRSHLKKMDADFHVTCSHLYFCASGKAFL